MLRFVVELFAAGFLADAAVDLDLEAVVGLDPLLAELLFEAAGFLAVLDLEAAAVLDPPLAELLFAAAGFLVVDEADFDDALVGFAEVLLVPAFFDELADDLDFALTPPDLEADVFDGVAFEPDDLDAPGFEVDADLALEDFLVVAMILFSSVNRTQ